VHGAVTGGQPRFELVEPPGELVVGLAQRGFRLDVELAGKVRQREQQVTQLFCRPRGTLVQRLAELAHFLVNLVDHVCGPVPVESHGGHARTDLVGAQQGGQRSWNTAQHALLSSRRSLFLRLELFPLLQHSLRRAGRAALARACKRTPVRLKDVRVPPDQLVDDRLDRVRDVEAAALGGDL